MMPTNKICGNANLVWKGTKQRTPGEGVYKRYYLATRLVWENIIPYKAAALFR